MPEFPIDVLRSIAHGSDPAAVANTGKFYTKTVDGVVKGFYRADDGTVTQIGPLLPTATVPYSALTNAINVNSAALAMSTGVQNLHSPSGYALGVSSAIRLRGAYCIVLTTPSSHNLSLRFAFSGGGGVTTSFAGLVSCWSAASGVNSGQPRYTLMASSGSQVISSTGVFDLRFFTYDCFAYTNASTSGTLTPQINFSATPAVSGTVPLATCEITPLGADTFTNQGGWS
jgi:hypothetical protein